MKKLTAFFLSLLLYFYPVAAMCPAIFNPPQRAVMPDDNTHALLVFENGIEKLILEPAFHGDSKDFGMVMPLPSKPEINEADEKIFKQLEDITNPIIKRATGGFGLFSAAASAQERVEIIEQKDVGDFKVTVLKADSSQALINWLNENGYLFSQKDKANFDYYVERSNYYFVAMKINADKARCLTKTDIQGRLRQELLLKFRSEQITSEEYNKELASLSSINIETGKCIINGKLRPIEFAFSTEKPMLPLRIMAGDMEQMTFTVYTLADAPYYIPGVKILYSQRLGMLEIQKAPTLEKYKAYSKWLVRNQADFDPAKIGEDLYFERGSGELVVDTAKNSKVANPEKLSAKSGILTAGGNVVRFASVAPLPGMLDFPAFVFSDIIKSLAVMAAGLAESVLPAVSIILLLFIPPLFLVYIPPIVLGMLFHRRTAGLATFIGINIIGFASLIFGRFDIPLTMLFVASLFGLFAFIASDIARRSNSMKKVQTRFTNLGLKTAVFVNVVSYFMLLLPIITLSYHQNILTLMLLYVVVTAILYTFIKHLYRPLAKPKDLEFERIDYLIPLAMFIMFAVAVFMASAIFGPIL